MDVVETLRGCTLFAKFGDNGLALMSKIAETRNVPAGTPLVVAGMPGESLLLIQSGEVALELRVGDRMVPLTRLGAGACLGQLSLLNPGPRLVSAVAATDLTVVEIPRKTFLKLHALKPQVSLKLMMSICEDYAAAAREAAPAMLKMVAF